MSIRFVAFVLLPIVVAAFSVNSTNAMEGELRLYKEPSFKRLRLLVKISEGNLCYDMACDGVGNVISSARWTGLPTTGSAFTDGHVKIAFYDGKNCTGKATVLNTNVGEISNFAQSGMDNATTSIAVLETSNKMQHATKNLCQW
ncbi:hypothetical protein L917_15444 [Phytophthora nicotianae]|uniref:RxLR effector protein n=5 Tax=Phytophthora nicotianae TaxID=4792 RepID=W2PS73_PHYN3|nr:hypothetical protein PPTG_15723 [Phytophthora nicotianae INRA-310]ETI37993.1 hypothetical protein F443_16175 [Phytophthora nicotianae P1569]ETL84850.1 hypothetical protein L917_15444 [Phytophthora nicotianae]ETO66749.1 hypothetical protein F444_16159 [Phytophthora nicotianae P1976]ETM38027.1 hypothetical protein L914_15579 [Phytophthora nicotianae]ETN03496.1 hypothetical protein PPTG_15723 [Phytophthora nicotianae INRA-310]